MANDRQTRALYDWEGYWLEWCCHDPVMTLPKSRKVVRWACRFYRVPAPTVRWMGRHSRRQDYPYYEPDDHSIHFNPKSNNLATTIHEAAHAVADWLLGVEGEIHSPEFVGIYLWLLAKKQMAPKRALKASLEQTRVRFKHPGKMSPKAVHARYRARIRAAAEARAADA